MKDIHHTCRCTGQQFTFKEWCAWIESHEKAGRDSGKFVALSHNGFDFNIHDVCLTPNRPVRLFNAHCIEMKTTDRRSALSDAQIEWRSLAITNGSRHAVCRTFEEFQSEIRWYMARPANNEPRDEITCARPIVPPSVEEIEREFGKIRRRKVNHQPTKTTKQ